ncbi:hypothetical protein BKA58DRAFT_467051 [Alternaria rosae]|uniref:uncharacterized protein n=1 Tax=Alternaria rosae TaxID=1187941 RepID=UPI001E8D5F74|nr:uncharacterized protein BKA58DRAFT_467051 [Alternaria rosae]KAH6875226.1 hypothetical protein BKA58DRAFT_467051 [Alternaria rosae]
MTATPTATFITDQNVIEGFNRGSITTVFTPPPSCTETITSATGALFVGHYRLDFDQECYPKASGPSEAPAPSSGWDAYYYSPAICPAGWTAATTFTSAIPIHPTPSAYSLGSATTAALCCPLGYSLFLDGHQCSSIITANQVLTVRIYDGPFSSSNLSISTQASDWWVFGDGVPIMWQSTDSAVLARATFTASSQTITGPTQISPSTSPTDKISSTETPSSSPGGLSTGVKAGLGVGITVAVIVLLVVAFLLGKRRRRHYEHTPATQEYAMPGHDVPKHGEFDQGNLGYHEMQADHARTEMQANPVEITNQHELPNVAH